jgi:hypothetical protein
MTLPDDQGHPCPWRYFFSIEKKTAISGDFRTATAFKSRKQFIGKQEE